MRTLRFNFSTLGLLAVLLSTISYPLSTSAIVFELPTSTSTGGGGSITNLVPLSVPGIAWSTTKAGTLSQTNWTTIASGVGAGAITRQWMAIGDRATNASIRISFDGATVPQFGGTNGLPLDKAFANEYDRAYTLDRHGANMGSPQIYQFYDTLVMPFTNGWKVEVYEVNSGASYYDIFEVATNLPSTSLTYRLYTANSKIGWTNTTPVSFFPTLPGTNIILGIYQNLWFTGNNSLESEVAFGVNGETPGTARMFSSGTEDLTFSSFFASGQIYSDNVGCLNKTDTNACYYRFWRDGYGPMSTNGMNVGLALQSTAPSLGDTVIWYYALPGGSHYDTNDNSFVNLPGVPTSWNMDLPGSVRIANTAFATWLWGTNAWVGKFSSNGAAMLLSVAASFSDTNTGMQIDSYDGVAKYDLNIFPYASGGSFHVGYKYRIESSNGLFYIPMQLNATGGVEIVGALLLNNALNGTNTGGFLTTQSDGTVALSNGKLTTSQLLRTVQTLAYGSTMQLDPSLGQRMYGTNRNGVFANLTAQLTNVTVGSEFDFTIHGNETGTNFTFAVTSPTYPVNFVWLSGTNSTIISNLDMVVHCDIGYGTNGSGAFPSTNGYLYVAIAPQRAP